MTTTRPTLLHTGDSGHHVDILDAVQERNPKFGRQSYTRLLWGAAIGLSAVASIWAAVAGLRPSPAPMAATESAFKSGRPTPEWQPAVSADTAAATKSIAPISDQPAAPVAAMVPAPAEVQGPFASIATATAAAEPLKSEAEAPAATVARKDVSEPRTVHRKDPVSRTSQQASKREAPARPQAIPSPHPAGQARSQASADSKDADVELLSALMKHMRNASLLSDQASRKPVEPAVNCRSGTNQDARCSPRAVGR